MKTSSDIPGKTMADAERLTRKHTALDTIVSETTDYDRRKRMAELVKYAGTCDGLIGVDELLRWRRKGS